MAEPLDKDVISATGGHHVTLTADGTVWQAIYSVEGDAFKLNYVEAGGTEKRPTVFETGSGTEASIIVLQRSLA